jgi:hypothetical protein
MATKAKEKIDKTFAARVLADATVMKDKAVAAKHGIDEKTIGNYRRRLGTDTELADIFHNLQTLRNEKWAAQIPESIRRAMAFLDRCATECNPQIPEQVEQVNEYLKVLIEAQAMQEYIARRFAPADEMPTIVNPHQIAAGDAHAVSS